MKALLLFTATFGFFMAFSQADDLLQSSRELQYADQVYRPYIRSVFLHRSDDPRSFPAIDLRRNQQLLLSFDDLQGQGTTYNYSFIHCDAHWQPSDLLSSEYLFGYSDFYFTDFDFSFNTFVPFTHYQLSFPNEEIRFTKSGNYLLVVYEDDIDEPVLTRRFVVYENLVSASGNVVRPNRVEYRDTHQELDFIIQHGGYDIPDAFGPLHVTLLQNQQWSSAITNLQPRFLHNSRLDYNYDLENLFPGLNEWRNFDTKDERNLSQNVRRIELDTNFTYFLNTDLPRNIGRYSTEFDINGHRVIRNTNASDEAIEADYVWVDFQLRNGEADPDVNLYVFGALSNWRIDSRFRLRYDYTEKAYRAQILLKQGYYNYMYAAVRDGQRVPDLGEIEGNHWETENDYYLIVYHREIGIRYDRVIGFATFSSSDLY